MNDREALATALDAYDEEIADGWTPDETLALFAAVAHKTLAQLPEKCGTCGGEGQVYNKPGSEFHQPMLRWYSKQCPTCHGRGTVYPPALVERIAEILGGSRADYERAVAVLGELNDWKPDARS